MRYVVDSFRRIFRFVCSSESGEALQIINTENILSSDVESEKDSTGETDDKDWNGSDDDGIRVHGLNELSMPIRTAVKTILMQ
jgi:hypothetical protein